MSALNALRLFRRAAAIPAALALMVVMTTPGSSATNAGAHHVLVRVGANQSNNWSGYNQGLVEKGHPFTQVAGDWVVPTASAHKSGEAEFSSTWVGIGGGCVESSCLVPDPTLIQAGTEQDVDSSGKATYSAWWEIIPAPSITITTMSVRAGDHMHVDIGEVVPLSNVWTITVKDLTNGQTFTQTTPYTSTHATAEWIEETPVVFGTNGVQVGPLPKLSTVNFDLAQANGANPQLTPAEEMQLVDGSGNPLATPSAPDSDTDGFNDCAYASSCAVPAS